MLKLRTERGREGPNTTSSHTLYESLPTSWVLSATADDSIFSGPAVFGSGGGFLLSGFGVFLLSSSAEESAVILRRFSTGEDTEDVLRLLLAAGAYRCIERCLFLSLCLLCSGLLLAVSRRAGLGSRSLLLLRLRLRRRSSR